MLKNHFPLRSNRLERFARVKSSWTAIEKSEIDGFVELSHATDNTEISPIAYAVKIPRGEHLLLQSKRSSPAVNRDPGRPTDLPWPLLYATTITLLATYLQNSAAYSGIFWLMEEKWMQSDWKATALSTNSRQIEDSLLHNAPWLGRRW